MERRSRADLGALLTIFLVIAALYLGRPLLMPLALALLVTFLPLPLVDRLERVGLGRTLSVVAVLVMLGAAAGGTGWMVASEASVLAEDLPQYRANLRTKIRELRDPMRHSPARPKRSTSSETPSRSRKGVPRRRSKWSSRRAWSASSAIC